MKARRRCEGGKLGGGVKREARGRGEGRKLGGGVKGES